MQTKLCTKCQIEKTLDQFNKNSSPAHIKNHFGYYHQCKECRQKYYDEHREILRAQQNKYIANRTPEQKDRIKQYGKDTYKKRIEENENYSKDQYAKMQNYFKGYYQKNRSRIVKRQRKYLNNNPNQRIAHNLRNRLWSALLGATRSKHMWELIGITDKEFQLYIESKFTEGMTWENYGKNGWHIDHIVPCSAFDLTDPIELKQCCHYTNLQPLWAKDNLSKNDKWII